MSFAAPSSPPPFARSIALHSLGWLVAANVVGVWLAASLLWPALGNLLAPFTWGRWTPLHMTWHLYGWCALPLVGVLLFWYLDPAHPDARRHARIALGAWTAALVFGGLSWLGGVVSGKLFLDWHGWARPLLPLAMLALWTLLIWHARLRWTSLPASERAFRVGLLVLLSVVPVIIYWAAGRRMYHPVNPGSGGATGAAVLGSTLGIVTLFMFVPRMLGIVSTRPVRFFYWALAASWAVFAFTDRGNISHHTLSQIVALGTLFIWVPLLPLFWRRQAWPRAAIPWIYAASVWWILLVADGWFSFLPGISEQFKFTHALVGHAHLAMAGLITSLNVVILVCVTQRSPGRVSFWLWQGGCALYIAAMLGLGWEETQHLADFFRGSWLTQTLLALRLAAGTAMAAASIRWLVSFLRS